MPNIRIIINQAGHAAGSPGVSRDDLSLSDPISGELAPIILTNYPSASIGVTSWHWSFVSRPKTLSTDPAPTLYGHTTDTASFYPNAYGTYIIELTLNRRITGRIGAAIKSASLHYRIPSQNENDEFPGGWGFGMEQCLQTIDSYGSILKSPNGSFYKINVDNSGNLSTTKIS